MDGDSGRTNFIVYTDTEVDIVANMATDMVADM